MVSLSLRVCVALGRRLGMLNRSRWTHGVLALALVGFAGVVVHAGDLNPPVGPIAPTMKTLDEVEPRIIINATNTPGDADSVYRITQPGSYYLTESIAGVAGKSGLEIDASNVKVDLMGFEIVGVAGAYYGVWVTSGTRFRLCNGTVRNFQLQGVFAQNAHASVYSDLTIADNEDTGIVTGSDCIVENCTAYSNTKTGFNIGRGCVVRGCVAYLNEDYGMALNAHCIVENCTARDNQWAGIYATFESTVIRNCHAYSNWIVGIKGGINAVIEGCTSEANGQEGFILGSGSITNCSAHNNTKSGIQVSSDCIVRGNVCTSNGEEGVLVSGSRCRIEGNTVSANDNGIKTSTFNDNIVIDNIVSTNTVRGIFVQGHRGRIERNHVTSNPMGVVVSGVDNVIIGNYAADNSGTNYEISSNNRYGPIVNWTLGGTVPASGNSASSSLTSTDPFANFAN